MLILLPAFGTKDRWAWDQVIYSGTGRIFGDLHLTFFHVCVWSFSEQIFLQSDEVDKLKFLNGLLLINE